MGQLVNHTSFQFNGTVVLTLSVVVMITSSLVRSPGPQPHAAAFPLFVVSLAIIAFFLILLSITKPAVMRFACKFDPAGRGINFYTIL
jgi:hypothetical protein